MTRTASMLEQLDDAEGLLIDAEGGRWATSGWAQAVRFEPSPVRLRASAPAPRAPERGQEHHAFALGVR